MKISELKKIKNELEKKEQLSATELATLQEVNYQINVNETLMSYYLSFPASIRKSAKEAQILYICFSKFVSELSEAFFFSSSEKEKSNKQNEKREKLRAVTQSISNFAKNPKLGKSIEKNPDKFTEILSNDFSLVVGAFDEFRETIINIEKN